MKILLLSAYDAQSHRQWWQGLQDTLSDIDWTVVTLAPRFFNWRIRGNPLSWFKHPALQQSYDLVLATSMVDVATIKGLATALNGTPWLVYFHENQFAYPVSKKNEHLEPKMVSLYAALAAEALLFNSRFNLATFMAGVEQLLAQMPDQVPMGISEAIKAKAQVVHVPIPARAYIDRKRNGGPLTVIWNHRWEYDKGPDRLLMALNMLPPHISILFHIVGQGFRTSPPEFAQIKALLQERGWLGTWGFVAEESCYRELLASSHVVLSTAIHDFQGLSIMEGAAAGCVPLVPPRLAYGEFFHAHLYCYGEPNLPLQGEARALADQLQSWANTMNLPPVPWLSHLSEKALASKYRQVFDAVVHIHSSQSFASQQ